MKRLTTAAMLLTALLYAAPTFAASFEGVSLPDQYEITGHTLQLNGQGMRSKFFFSIYVGALYTPHTVTSAAAVMDPQLPKVIRLHFVYDEVSAKKLRDGFAESLDNNIPGFSTTAAGRDFLAIFNFNALENDTVDLQFLPGGALVVLYNGKQVGRLDSPATCKAVLNIYFGPEPIESLKEGMLGG